MYVEWYTRNISQAYLLAVENVKFGAFLHKVQSRVQSPESSPRFSLCLLEKNVYLHLHLEMCSCIRKLSYEREVSALIAK